MKQPCGVILLLQENTVLTGVVMVQKMYFVRLPVFSIQFLLNLAYGKRERSIMVSFEDWVVLNGGLKLKWLKTKAHM